MLSGRLRSLLGIVCVSIILPCLGHAQRPLHNGDVVRMVRHGDSVIEIVDRINNSPSSFTMDYEDVKSLRQDGVPEIVIKAMFARQTGERLQLQSNPATPSTSEPAVASDNAAFHGSPKVTPAGPVYTHPHVQENTVGLPPQSAAPDILTLHDGTPVRLRLNRNLSSSDAKAGETADFEVLEDVKVGDLLVITRGATAIATVTEAEPKRRMARGGKLNVNIDFVRALNDEKIALRAVKETKGGGHTGAMTGGIVATSIVFFPAAPFFLFMHGKDITIPKGTDITAYVNGDVTLEGSKFIRKSVNAPAVQTTTIPTVQTSGRAMSNQDVIDLKAAGLSDTVVIAKIRAAPGNYKTDTEDLIALKRADLSEGILEAMIEAQSRPRQ